MLAFSIAYLRIGLTTRPGKVGTFQEALIWANFKQGKPSTQVGATHFHSSTKLISPTSPSRKSIDLVDSVTMDNPSQSPSTGPSASMANRGRYNSFSSKVGSGINNSARRMRKRRDPTPFNILIIGAKNCGKSSFLNLLRSSLGGPDDRPDDGKKSVRKNTGNRPAQNETRSTAAVSNRRLLTFSSCYVESKIENEDFGITIWDSEGLSENMIDLQLRDIVTFLESKFEETFDEEVKLVRDPGVRDSQVHCVFYLLDPVRIELNMAANSSRKAGSMMGSTKKKLNFDDCDQMMMEGGCATTGQRSEGDGDGDGVVVGGGLDAKFDLQALQMLCEKTTVIPIVSKADTVTSAQMSHLKRAVWESIRANGLDPFDIINRNSPDNFSPQAWPRSSVGSISECRSYSIGDDDEMMKNRNDDDGNGKTSSSIISSSLSSSSSSSSSSTPSAAAAADAADAEAGNNGARSRGSRHHRPHEARKATSNMMTTTPPPPPPPPILPLSIISPDIIYNQGFPGRDFPWGAAQTDNPLHCDYSKLKELVFVEWRDEMREASRLLWYERWRTARLARSIKNASTRMEVGNSRRQQHQHPAGGK